MPPGPITSERLGGHPAVAALLPSCTFPVAGSAVVAGLSGGADSTAMTVLAVAAGCVVTTVHVHHGLRPSADHDAAVAARTAARLGIDHRTVHVDLQAGANLAARARLARRNAFGAHAMTGHTADDQAETLLLALLRGAGATGLAAIRPGPEHPILRLRRSETVALCAALDIEVAIDPTNDDQRFRRNRVRRDLLPLLDRIAERDVTPLLGRTADLLRDDDELLEELASAIDPTDARQLAEAPIALARRAVRRWLTFDGYPPDSATVARVIAVASGTAVGCDVGCGRRVERSHQRLRLCHAPAGGG